MKMKSGQQGRWWRRRARAQDACAVGFFGLWRHATAAERLVSALGCACAVSCAAGLQLAVMVYGELTALLPARAAAATQPRLLILPLFGGGVWLSPNATRADQLDALVQDSVAFALSSVAVMALQWAGAAAAVALTSAAAQSMTRRLRYLALKAALRQEIAYYDTDCSFNLTTVITEDMEKLRLGAGPHAAMGAYLASSVAVSASTALALGWQLALAGLAVVPLAVAVAALAAKYQSRYASSEAAATSAAARAAQEALAGVRTVRACQGEQVEMGRFSRLTATAARWSRRRGLSSGAGAGAGWLLTYALNALVLATGARLCVRDMDLPPDEQEYNPGIMVTILFSTFMAAQNIAMCHPHLEVLSSARGAAAALYALLARQPANDALADHGIRPHQFRGDIKIEDVYFNYPARPDVKVLRGLSLSVSAGETVALVGPSGSGKSTVLQLILRLYEPHSGRISVDGQPLDQLALQHYRQSIGVVGQEPVLFSGSIAENITLGLRDVTQKQLEAAARTANAHGFISKLKEGYNTQVGSGGAALSGGQKQRIAIARALLRDPKILLLDEPTSALDPAAERQVQAALDAASVGRTTLVVSHRLSTIVNASRVVYVQQGAVLEQGTYRELLEKKGAFYQLLQSDMTQQAPQTAADAADDDEILDDEEPMGDAFKRQITRLDSTRASLSPEHRGSQRLASVAAAHAPPAAADTHQEVPDDPSESTQTQPAAGVGAVLALSAPEWRLLAAGSVAALLLGATMPAFALLFSKIYGMFATRDAAEILRQAALYAGLFLGCAALCGLVTFLQTWIFSCAGTRLTRRLRMRVFHRFLSQQQTWLDAPDNSVGALCSRLATDCAAVQGATGTRLGTVLQGISTMTLGVALAMVFSWKMTLVSLLSVPCVMGGIYLEGWMTQRAEERQRRAAEGACRLASETVLHLRTVHSLGAGEALLSRYAVALQASAAAAGAAALLRGPVYGLCLCAPTLGYAVSLAYGGYLIARESMPYEYAILVSEALIYGAWMMAESLSFAPGLAAARRAAGRIATLLADDKTCDKPSDKSDGDDTWSASGDVSLNAVHFSYPDGSSVLRGLTLRLRAGRSTALVGGSGCGKSTALQLLARVYEPDGGTIEISGRDIRTISLDKLRAQMALVSQEPVLFERSIRDNIAYGAVNRFARSRPNSASSNGAGKGGNGNEKGGNGHGKGGNGNEKCGTENQKDGVKRSKLVGTTPEWEEAEERLRAVPLDAVVAAARQANIHEFITSLPQGYDTWLGSGGAALSGGQKQRIAIARALLRDPKILLLDEATSALDAASEQAVQSALEAASRGRTTVVVAHRLATVRHADHICVIDKGVVVEEGSHTELVRLRGRYYDLLQQQAADDTPKD